MTPTSALYPGDFNNLMVGNVPMYAAFPRNPWQPMVSPMMHTNNEQMHMHVMRQMGLHRQQQALNSSQTGQQQSQSEPKLSPLQPQLAFPDMSPVNRVGPFGTNESNEMSIWYLQHRQNQLKQQLQAQPFR